MRARVLRVIGVFALALGVFGAGVYAESERRLEMILDWSGSTPLAPNQPGRLEQGRHIGEVVAQCTFCHGEDWGGKKVSDDWIVGRLYSSNLTSGQGGISGRYSDEALAKAIRLGLDRTGRNLWFMPAEHYVALHKDDLVALIGYIRSLPAVDRVNPERWAGPATRLAVVLGLAPELVANRAAATPLVQTGHAEDKGQYLVEIGICRTCHRMDLKGGQHPLAPPHEPIPPDLTAGGPLDRWSQTDFVAAMRTGLTPGGRVLDPQFMPWPGYQEMTDSELRAIWRYLRGLRREEKVAIR